MIVALELHIPTLMNFATSRRSTSSFKLSTFAESFTRFICVLALLFCSARASATECSDVFESQTAKSKKVAEETLIAEIAKAVAQRDIARGLELAHVTLMSYPDSPIFLGRVVKIFLMARRYEDALRVIDMRIALNRRDAVAYGQKAQTLLKLGKYDEAFEVANQILAFDRKNVVAHGLQAQILMRRGKSEDALAVSDKLLNLDSRNLVAMGLKAQALMKLGKPEEALPIIERKLALEPRDQVALGLKTQALLKLERAGEALKVIEQLLKLDARNIVAMGLKTQALMKLGRSTEALQVIDGQLSINSRDVVAFVLKTQTLLQNKNYDAALMVAESIPDRVFRNYFSALALIEKGDFSRAEQKLKDMEQTRVVLWQRSRARFLSGDFAMAQQHLVHLIRISEKDPDSNTQQSWYLAALLKIEQEGHLARHPLLEAVLGTLGSLEAAKMITMSQSVKWQFLNDHISAELTAKSMLNPFWDGLNDTPVDRQTARSTR